MERTLEFQRLGISKPYLLSALEYFSFFTPSPVQTQSIPLALSGVDLVVESKSGSGKTLAFTLALLQRLTHQEGVEVLILSSTRELALQIYDFVNEMTVQADPPVYSCLCCGGYSITEIIKAIRDGVHIVVGTVGNAYAGRIVDLVQRRKLNLKTVKVCVLDEADKLVTFKDISRITSLLPKECQFLAYSATYDAESRVNLASFLKDSNQVKIPCEIASQLQEFSLEVAPDFVGKLESLLNLLKSIEFHQAVVFDNQRHRAKQISAALRKCGFPSIFMSGSKSQKKRCEDIKALRFLGVRVVTSTDYASRGVDVLNINLVINFDIPREATTYTHRIGRAGRFGTPGIAVTLISSDLERETLASYSNNYSEISTFDKVPFIQDKWRPLDLLECELLHMEALKAGEVLEADVEEGEWALDSSGQPMLVECQAKEGDELDRIQASSAGYGEWVDVPEEESLQSRFTVPLFLNTETMMVETLEDRFPEYAKAAKKAQLCKGPAAHRLDHEIEREDGELNEDEVWECNGKTAIKPPLLQSLPEPLDLEDGEIPDLPSGSQIQAPESLGSSSPKVSSVPMDIEQTHSVTNPTTISSASCALCHLSRYGPHCHCQVCIDNYVFIAQHLT